MVLSDIEIANSVQMKPITDIAAELGLTEDDISLYGKYKAKIDSNQLEQLKDKEDGKLILVTAISPTPAGEGKKMCIRDSINGWVTQFQDVDNVDKADLQFWEGFVQDCNSSKSF